MNFTPKDYFPYYMELTKGGLLETLLENVDNLAFFQSISEKQSNYRYAENKWSIKEILGHIIDHERISVYRALRLSRFDDTPIQGYDEGQYMNHARWEELPYEQLLEDYKLVRAATISFFKMLSKKQLGYRGKVWKFECSPADILRICIGHEQHHIAIIKERYLA